MQLDQAHSPKQVVRGKIFNQFFSKTYIYFYSDLEKISLPITSSTDLLTTFNPAQRLAIYDFASKSTKCAASSLPLTEIDLIFE
jgi:hypothetical protein